MSSAITPVQYRSHDREYRLDVEVLDAAELRSRVAAVPDRGYERTDFQCFLFVESGAYRHVVDFELHECRAGSCVSIRPGQVHRFGPTSDWSGWILIAGPHHVPETVADLPSHIRLDGSLAEATAELFGRMAADAFLAADRLLLDDLLALQTRVLAQRLALGEADGGGATIADPTALDRYRALRAAVDENFDRWHQVQPYADHLGHSRKSLDRACRAVSDMSAKRVIVERIVLEAKRLLAHTRLPVASVSDRLGFDEPTNFVKYFKRETGTTPARFRERLTGDEPG